jgi:signal transduction protein with GAF and PtsI domain
MPTLDDGSRAEPSGRKGPEEVAPAQERDAAGELRLLHEFLRLATTARTWEELLETVVDGTRDALRADVTSLYLLDRDGLNLRLAATNGLDSYQIGRAIVPFGEGITGRVAAMRQPIATPDVREDDRFLWVRGIDQRRFVHSMLSVPLTWRDQVVGVLNVQTETHREFGDADVAQLSAIADLLAGILEKGRLQAEAEAHVKAERAAKYEAEARAKIEGEERDKRERAMAATLDAERKAKEEAEQHARMEVKARETL